MIYFLLFNQDNTLNSVIPEKYKRPETVYYPAPIEFDPLQHSAILDSGVVKLIARTEKQPSAEELLRRLIRSDYVRHEFNGLQYYNETRENLVVSIVNGQRTISQVLEIEAATNSTSDALRRGDWVSALAKISAQPVAGAFDQSYKDSIIARISNYIEVNYNVQLA